METKTIVITGANRGIGLELARAYCADGHRVFGLCRTASEALSKLDVQVIEGVDVGDTGVGAKLGQALADVDIDILINNAGILRSESLDDMNFETMTEQFRVNSLGPLRVTHALLDRLHDGSKIGLITSRMGSIADNTSGSRYGYRMSKAALNIAGVSLAHDLQPKGIAVAIIHPGFVQTEMVGGAGDITPDEAAKRITQRISDLNLNNTGTFWHSSGDELPW